MLYPFVLAEGVIFDGRTIVVSLCTVFFGPLSGIIASAIALTYRFFLGGPGSLTGSLFIISSFLIGYLFYRRHIKNTELTNFQLYQIGFFVHAVVLILFFTLPSTFVFTAYKTVGLTIIGIFPFVSLLIGKILVDQEKRQELIYNLTRSEAKFRALAESSPYAIFIFEREKFLYVNKAMEDITGYDMDELLQIPFWTVVHEDHQELVKDRGRRRLDGEKVEGRYRIKLRKKNGDIAWVDLSSTIIEYDGKVAALGTAYDITQRVKYMMAVEEQKELFETTLYSIGDAVITTDIDGNVKHMNPVAEKLTGWTEQESEGNPLKSIFKIINEGTRLKVVNPVDEVLKKGQIVGLANHTLLISKDGAEIPISDSGAPIKNNNNEITGVVLVFRDQTEERAAEKRLKESEQKFRSLVDSAFDGIYLMSDKNYSIVNERFAQITGYTKEELLDKNFDVNTLLSQKSKKLVWERYLARQRGEELPATYEIEIVTKPGNVKNVELSTVSMGSANNVSVIGIMRDVSSRKRNEQLIWETMRMLERAEEQVLLGSWSYDLKTRKGFWSSQMYKLFNLNPADKVPSLKEYLNLIHPEDRKDLIQVLSAKQTLEGDGLRLKAVRTNPQKVGRKYIQHAVRAVKNDSGEIGKFEGTVLDITEKVITEKELTMAKEEAEKANQLKSEFLAQVSHEIRSPLNAVLNFSSIIKEETRDLINEDLQISFDGIESASLRVIRTIDLILNMSELQLGTYNVIKRRINLRDQLKNLIREYKNLAVTKNLSLVLKSEIENAEIETDDYAVNQIFANLIDNSIKYTKKGFIEILLYRSVNNKYTVEVRDSGVGMTKDYLIKIFDPFSQEEHGYSRKFEGSGLGMSLVKKYVDLIKADIKVESEKDKGTSFIVTFSDN